MREQRSTRDEPRRGPRSLATAVGILVTVLVGLLPFSTSVQRTLLLPLVLVAVPYVLFQTFQLDWCGATRPATELRALSAVGFTR